MRLAAVKAYLDFAGGGQWRESAPPHITREDDRRLYTQLLRGAVRHKRLLEAEVARLSGRPLARLDAPVAAVALLGLLQVRFLKLPAHAVVYETVELVTALGNGSAKGLVNGVLRAALRERESGADPAAAYSLGVRTSHPDWLVERWQRRYGDKRAAAVCAADDRFEGSTVRAETRRIPCADLLERLAAEGVSASAHPLLPGAIQVARLGDLLRSPAFAEGLCYVQDVASQVLTAWVAPHLGTRAVDLCAAPGGKLTHLLGLRAPGLWLVAADSDPRRLARVRENLARLRLPSLPLLAADGRALPFSPARPWDAVLLDVPCSATGMIRKYPELKWRKHEDDLARYGETQRALLDEAARHVAPGGLIVYSTCSLEPEENEEQIAAFLSRRGDFARVPFTALPAPHGLGAPPEELLNAEGDLLVLPAGDRLGLYGALLRRV